MSQRQLRLLRLRLLLQHLRGGLLLPGHVQSVPVLSRQLLQPRRVVSDNMPLREVRSQRWDDGSWEGEISRSQEEYVCLCTYQERRNFKLNMGT